MRWFLFAAAITAAGSGCDKVWGGFTLSGGISDGSASGIDASSGCPTTAFCAVTLPNVSPLTSLKAIFGTRDTDIWAAGSGGVILHRDGTTWSVVPSGVAGVVSGIWASDSSHAWAVHDSGLLAWDGASWAPIAACTQPLYALAGTSSGQVWAGGTSQSTYCYFNGASWAKAGPSPTSNTYAMWAGSTSGYWSSGANGTTYQGNGTGWTPSAPVGINTIRGIWGTDIPSTGWMVGENGTILQLKTGAWAPAPSPTANSLNAVSGNRPNNIYAVGDSGTVLVGDGTTWNSMNSGLTVSLYGVWVAASGTVWAVGDNRTIVRMSAP